MNRWLFTFALATLPLLGATAGWRPVSTEELARKHSSIDPNAAVEVLFKDIRIERGANTNYLRYKIYSDHGLNYATVRLEYGGRTRISNIAGRTIHPDGRTIELNPAEVFDTVQAKAKGLTIRVISFALPAVEVGSVIEYTWTENHGRSNNFLDVQEDVPLVEADFHIKTRDDGPGMRFLPLSCNPAVSHTEKGFVTLIVRNLPAYQHEPFSPPERSARASILAFYDYRPAGYLGNIWTDIANYEFEILKKKTRLSGEFKTLANEVAKGNSDEEKLRALAEYCRKTITNVDDADASSQDRDEFRSNKNANDILNQGSGTAEDLHIAFIALARAAGYDARLAQIASRKHFLFNPYTEVPFFLTNIDAVVDVGGKWKFYDLSNKDLPLGSISWDEQAAHALIPDPSFLRWIDTPLLSASESRIERIAELTLSTDGTVEGDIRELHWGNEAGNWRATHKHETDAECQESLRAELKEQFPDIEVSAIKVSANKADLPVGVQYHVVVKHYADTTAKRLFVRPSFFTTGSQPYFPAAERTNDIYFKYPWSEEDRVIFHVPPEYKLDHPGIPPAIELVPVVSYLVQASFDAEKHLLSYSRSFRCGQGEVLQFKKALYSNIKGPFDRIHTADQQLMTFIQEPSTK